jgi:hypothetical protein
MQDAFQNSKVTPHWPMYLRNVKQFIKNSSPTFDEHRYGFHSFLEAVRSAQRAGLFRLERNRQGILRVYPGNLISQMRPAVTPRSEEAPLLGEGGKPYDVEDDITLQQQPEPEPPVTAAPVEDVIADVQPEVEEQPRVIEEAAPAEAEKPSRKRRASSGLQRKTAASRKTTAAGGRKTRKKAATTEEESS